MPRNLVSQLEDYAEKVRALTHLNEPEWVVELFIRRELIDDALRSGASLPIAAQAQLEDADKTLLRRRSFLMKRVGDLFSLRAPDIPRRYWWWYLNEGPQVREHAEATAQGS